MLHVVVFLILFLDVTEIKRKPTENIVVVLTSVILKGLRTIMAILVKNNERKKKVTNMK